MCMPRLAGGETFPAMLSDFQRFGRCRPKGLYVVLKQQVGENLRSSEMKTKIRIAMLVAAAGCAAPAFGQDILDRFFL